MDRAIEAAARAYCASHSYDPDDIITNGKPRWQFYVPGLEAAIKAYDQSVHEQFEEIFERLETESDT